MPRTAIFVSKGVCTHSGLAAKNCSYIGRTLIKPEARRTNLLDEGIDQYKSMGWTLGRKVVHHCLTGFEWGAVQYPVEGYAMRKTTDHDCSLPGRDDPGDNGAGGNNGTDAWDDASIVKGQIFSKEFRF